MDLVRVGQRVSLVCSCAADVVVSVVLLIARHHLVRIVSRGAGCQDAAHTAGARRLVRSSYAGRHRVFKDVWQA